MEEFLELKAVDLPPAFTGIEITDFYVAIFPSVARLVSRLGGSLEEAKDIFHDALIIYWEQQSKNPGKIYGSEAGYILGIVKNLCLRQYQRDKKVISLSDAEQEIPIPPDFYPTVRQRRLLRVLERAGKKCLDLLRSFYYQMVPLRKIARDFNYANEHSASVQKYKCLDKVKKVVAENSLNYEDFLE
jgi:DNA-directed RNA polymerase specialized sigma24 family protein